MLFSVIVPIYNVEPYLRRCVDSVLSQTCPDFEVLLVDDGSTDRCPKICDEYAEKDPRVRVIHKENGGLVSARNAGIFAAKGDYLCYVDGDDFARPRLLEFVRERLSESPVPLDMVMFAADNFSDEGEVPFLNKVPEGLYGRERLEKEIFPYLLSDRRNGFRASEAVMAHTWDKVSRRELQLEHYVRDERIRMFTDVPFTYEILLNCQNVLITNKRLYCYNTGNPNSILALGKRNYLTKSFGYLVPYMQQRLRDYGPEIRRQLNDYPALLLIRTALWRLQTEETPGKARRLVRQGLEESGMLRYISIKGLPFKPAALTLLFKLRLDGPAMALCALRNRRPRL